MGLLPREGVLSCQGPEQAVPLQAGVSDTDQAVTVKAGYRTLVN